MPKGWLDYLFIGLGVLVMLLGFYIVMDTDIANPKDLYNIPLGAVMCLAGALVLSVRVK